MIMSANSYLLHWVLQIHTMKLPYICISRQSHQVLQRLMAQVRIKYAVREQHAAVVEHPWWSWDSDSIGTLHGDFAANLMRILSEKQSYGASLNESRRYTRADGKKFCLSVHTNFWWLNYWDASSLQLVARKQIILIELHVMHLCKRNFCIQKI